MSIAHAYLVSLLIVCAVFAVGRALFTAGMRAERRRWDRWKDYRP